ncbi:MAG: ABC transporter substrate-binding protein, partial [Chloroflexota bacterium]
TPTTPTEEKPQKEVVAPTSGVPKYGGTLRLALTADITNFDDVITRGFTQGITFLQTNESLWRGDWAKGPAGGYGTNESDWVGSYDVFGLKAGFAAESWKWSADAAKNEGILVYQTRKGIRYALNPNSEASRLAAGREMTADDVAFSFRQVMTTPTAYMYRAYPTMRTANITKTGPNEVTIKVPLADLITAIAKFGNYVGVVPPEVVAKYGSMASWKNSVGTGPFMLTDYIPGSQAVLTRNPNYWGKDPVGLGKGNQLPYLDTFQYLVIPDASTRLAALRTGKVDQMSGIAYEDAASMRKTTPALKEAAGQLGGPAQYVYMNTQRKPFNDIKVRRAMLMSVDLESIKASLNHGLGQVLTWPVELVKGYEDVYLGLDDPAMPASVKELYTYNPTKAKQLLTEAGYPNGFKTTALIAAPEVDYFSIIKDMWSKVGIDLSLNIQETGQRTAIYNTGNYDIVGAVGGRGPISVFYHMVTMRADGPVGGNAAQINDPVIVAASDKMKEVYITDEKAAMKLFKELMKHVLDQAYVVSRPIYPQATFWWPWLKNYSGEIQIGYFDTNYWASFIWIDQALKKSMGY